MASRRLLAALVLVAAPGCAFWSVSDWDEETDRVTALDALSEVGAPDVVDAGPPLESGAPIALDTFTRDVTGALGSADLGGAWTTSTNQPLYAVSDGAARFTVNAALSVEAYLYDVVAQDVDVSASFSTSKLANANGVYASLVARVTKDDLPLFYSLSVRLPPTSAPSVG